MGETTAFDYPPAHGKPVQITPLVRLLLCPNPSPMTFHGTNTYIVGTKDLAVIDPGPSNRDHLDAILQSVQPGQHISHIIVTHGHKDHSPLAAQLSAETNAPIYGYGNATAGRSSVMRHLAQTGFVGGGEGVDTDFQPESLVSDGDSILGSDWQLDVIHTPGHLGNHISLAMGDVCFTGDHVMGWSTSLVSPPDGDLTDFMASCARLAQHSWNMFLPGHGAPVTAPLSRLQELITHRQAREAAILGQLNQRPVNQRPATVAELTVAIYTDTPAALIPAAERNVFAHLIDLYQKNRVSCNQEPGFHSQFWSAT